MERSRILTVQLRDEGYNAVQQHTYVNKLLQYFACAEGTGMHETATVPTSICLHYMAEEALSDHIGQS